jgi:hypothetical protein
LQVCDSRRLEAAELCCSSQDEWRIRIRVGGTAWLTSDPRVAQAEHKAAYAESFKLLAHESFFSSLSVFNTGGSEVNLEHTPQVLALH